MKVFKNIVFYIMCLVDLYLLYSTIGYLILGIQTPVILGERTTYFMGMYMMSICFGVGFLSLTAILITVIIRNRRRRIESSKSKQKTKVNV